MRGRRLPGSPTHSLRGRKEGGKRRGSNLSHTYRIGQCAEPGQALDASEKGGGKKEGGSCTFNDAGKKRKRKKRKRGKSV